MKKINIIFFKFVTFAASLLVTSVAQAKDIKIGVSFRMLSDVGYKHGELIKILLRSGILLAVLTEKKLI